MKRIPMTALLVVSLWMQSPAFGAQTQNKVFKAGASAIDISPTGQVFNSSFIVPKEMGQLLDALHARTIVLDDGKERVAIIVADLGAMPRRTADRIKQSINERSGMPTDRILLSATHTHNGPAIHKEDMIVKNAAYIDLLVERIPEGVAQAIRNLRQARIGWTVIQDAEHTHTRRWIRRPDRIDLDPWGGRTVRANMHPGFQNPDVIGPSGPSDPDISIVSLQTTDGKPLALLANYAMHYIGVPAPADSKLLISADYYGRFAAAIAQRIAPPPPPRSMGFHSSFFGLPQKDEPAEEPKPQAVMLPPFVGIMAQGTSGDQMWADYSRAPYVIDQDEYAQIIADEVYEAYKTIEYHGWLPIRMAESILPLKKRTANAERLARSREIVAGMDGSEVSTWSEAFAVDALKNGSDTRQEHIKLQAISIGGLGFTAIPNEVYALTGLKLKAQSPLATTINMELANGSNLYLPPPEQFHLGGYTTWHMYGAALESQAEPKIVEAMLQLLEQVSGKPRRKLQPGNGPYARNVLDAKPLAYWRLEEMSGTVALDASGHGHTGTYEPGVAFYLEGPQSAAFSGEATINRAPHLAGGRISTQLKLPDNGTVEFWFWNGMPYEVRDTTGRLFVGGDLRLTLDRLGNLVFRGAGREVLTGPRIELKSWYHVAVVRQGAKASLYLNGKLIGALTAGKSGPLIFGGGADAVDTLEGKIDEVAIYAKPLSTLDIADHFRLAEVSNQRRSQLSLAADVGGRDNRQTSMAKIEQILRSAAKRSTMPIRNWPEALNRFTIMFSNRMPA